MFPAPGLKPNAISKVPVWKETSSISLFYSNMNATNTFNIIDNDKMRKTL